MPVIDKLRQLLEAHPAIASALIGAVTGAGAGAAFSDYGREGRGALQGALMGTGFAGTLGPLSRALAKVSPKPDAATLLGAVSGGITGGALGRRTLEPWVVQGLHEEFSGKPKEAAAMSEKSLVETLREQLTKEAGAVTDPAHVSAFDFGVETFLNANKLDKEAFAKKAGCTAEQLPEAMIQWLHNAMEQSQSAGKA